MRLGRENSLLTHCYSLFLKRNMQILGGIRTIPATISKFSLFFSLSSGILAESVPARVSECNLLAS